MILYLSSKSKLFQPRRANPKCVLRGRAETVTISISHRNGIAICAVAVGIVKLGCDLEIIEARSDAFIADYFTAEEQELIAQGRQEDRLLLVSLLWSAKESALKALHVGLRADTRSVEVKDVAWRGRCFRTVERFRHQLAPIAGSLCRRHDFSRLVATFGKHRADGSRCPSTNAAD